jgi:hypothetical protein
MRKRLVPSKDYPNFSECYTLLTPFEQYLSDCKDANKTAVIEIKEPNHLASTYPCKSNNGYLFNNDSHEYDFNQD